MSNTDLDQGGTIRQTERVYLGPSIGWQYVANNAILYVTTGGATTVPLGVTLVRVDVAATVTLNLPSAEGNAAGAGPVPGTYLGRDITIVDEGGNAASFNITVAAFGSEEIDGAATAVISRAYGALVLTPNTPNGGWIGNGGASGPAGGDVVGPVSSTDNAFAKWDGITGELLKDGPVTIPVASGGTNLTSGTSGGVLAFTAAGTIASSSELTQHGVIVGGGAGAAPGVTAAGTNGQALIGNTGAAPTFQSQTVSISFIIDGGGSTITTGIKGDIGPIPFGFTIQSVTLLADQTGSIVIDIWEDTYANFPPDNSDSITASAPPTISTATKSQDSTLTGWDVTFAAGAILRFNVDSVTDLERVTLSLSVIKVTA